MGKVRTCPKCGRIESQYTYFCTECGTKTIESYGQVPSRKETTVGVSNAYKEQKPDVKAVTPADVPFGSDSLSAQREEADNVSLKGKIEKDASSDSVTAQKNASSVTISKKIIGIIAGALLVVIGVILVFSIGRNNISNDNLQLASKAENESDVGYSDSYELHADDGYKEQEQEYYSDQNEAEHSESVDYVEVPNWFVVNGVAVKGNKLCFSRDDGLQMGNGEYPLTVTHYVFDDSGSLYSMNEYIIFENEWSASQYADELNSYNNEGKKNFGMQMGDARYYSVGNILVEEFLPQYTQYNVGTLQDEITMFSDYGWSVEYVSSDGQQVEENSGEEMDLSLAEVEMSQPFYGVWISATKDENAANEMSANLNAEGLDAQVIITNEWSNLNSEKYYAITIGRNLNQEIAEEKLVEIKNCGYESAYIKYTGDKIVNTY